MTRCLGKRPPEWAGSLPIPRQKHPDSEPQQGATQPPWCGDSATIASQERKSGDVKHEGNAELHNSRDRERNPRAAKAGGGCKLISLHYLLGKHCPVESVGGSSYPAAGGRWAQRLLHHVGLAAGR